MRAVFFRHRGVAYRAGLQSIVSALQIQKLDAVIGLASGRNSMGAVMAARAINTAMLLGEAVQRLILLVGAAVAVGIVTAWFIQPRVRIFFDLLHTAMAIQAVHFVLDGHNITQALGYRTRVAFVAAFLILRYLLIMFSMYGFGKIGDA